MSDVESPKPSDESSDASSAKGAGASAAPTPGGADEIDINFGEPEAAPAAAAATAPGKGAAAKSAAPVSSRETESIPPAQSQRPSTTSMGERRSSVPASSVRDDRLPGGRSVEMGSSEQKKLEDIRRKLKDIFVTGEKPEPASDTVKASDQQTVSSGLLDLRHLAEARHGNRESAKVDDDMMHLSGGLFGGGARSTGPLTAPDLSKPAAPAPKPPPPAQAAKPVTLTDDAVMDLDPEPESAPRAKATTKPPATTKPVVAEPEPDFRAHSGMSSRTIVALTIGAAVLFGGVFYMVMRGGGDEATEPVSSAAEAKVEGQPTAEQGQRVGQPSTETTPPAADPGSAAVVPGSKPAADDKSSKSGDSASTKAPGPKPTADAKDPKEAAAPGPKPETTAATPPPTPAQTEAPKAPPPPAESGNEFDAGAARAAMNAAASRALACKGDGPAGTASVSVTFAPSGRVTSAKVEGGPFSGTPTGGCIATAFRGASVPPFTGSSVTVRKTVSLR